MPKQIKVERAPMVPLDVQGFRRKFSKYLLAQLGIVAISLSLYLWSRRTGIIDFEVAVILAFVVVEGVFNIRFVRSNITQARFLDIYPDAPSGTANRLVLSALLAFPLSFIIFVSFLLFRRRSEKLAVPLLFRKPKWFIAGQIVTILSLPVFACFIMFGGHAHPIRSASYYVVNPTSYYLVSLADEVTFMLELKERLKPESKTEKLIAELQITAKKEELSLTGIIMALSIDTSHYVKSQKANRDVASVPHVGETLALLNDVVTIVETRAGNSPDVFRYNPICFLEPSGAIEIGLISMVNYATELKFDQTFSSSVTSAIDELESRVKKEDGQNQIEIEKKIGALRARFEALPEYRKSQNLKQSWFWRLI